MLFKVNIQQYLSGVDGADVGVHVLFLANLFYLFWNNARAGLRSAVISKEIKNKIAKKKRMCTPMSAPSTSVKYCRIFALVLLNLLASLDGLSEKITSDFKLSQDFLLLDDNEIIH